MNYVMTLFFLIGSIFLFVVSLITWQKRNDKGFHQGQKVNLLYVVLVAFILIMGGIVFSLWILMTEPTEVMCRFGSCSFGPYAWSVAVLSLNLSFFFAVTFYLGIKRIISTRG